jgi:hypothetical protein
MLSSFDNAINIGDNVICYKILFVLFADMEGDDCHL